MSIAGGAQPQWSRDGRLFYQTPGDSLMVATITTKPKLAVTSRRTLFELHSRMYSVAPDGKRFAVARGGGDDQQIVVVLNWINELRAKMAAAGR